MPQLPVRRAMVTVQLSTANGLVTVRAHANDAGGELAELPATEQAERLAARAFATLVTKTIPQQAAAHGWAPSTGLLAHARRELELCGQIEEDPEYAASILGAVAAVAAFCAYDGHSGGSFMAAAAQLGALLRFEALSPLTADPAEWCDVAEQAGATLWQNRRSSGCFTDDPQFRTFWRVDDQVTDRSLVDGGRPRYHTGTVERTAEPPAAG